MDVRIDGGSDSSLTAFLCDSNEALSFRIVRSEAELAFSMNSDADGNERKESVKIVEGDSSFFHPDMTHQIYGQREKILGYRDLSIRMWLSCSSFKAFVLVDYKDALSPQDSNGLKRDAIMPPLLAIMKERQVCHSKVDFVKAIHSDVGNFKPPGGLICGFEKEKRYYEIYRAQVDEKGAREYHELIQFWLMFFVDGASFIDDSDPKWHFYFMFEKFAIKETTKKSVSTNESGNAYGYAFVGYCTVYHYYAYPDRFRPRISQMLILPPFQKRGLGAVLMDCIQKQYWKMDDVVDITVEDPADDFIRLRDYVDARNASHLSAYAPSLLPKGFSSDMVKEAKEKLKMCKKQARRAYEILRFKTVNVDDEEMYKEFRVDVKCRLNAPYRKEDRELSKLRKRLKPEEFAAASINITNREQRIESLKAQYNELEEHIQRIVDRLRKE